MADLSTSYMGIPLSSPVVVGASSISRMVDNIKRAQDAGAGALVIKSLFQEQIELEELEFREALLVGSERFPESITYFPQIEYAGPREHIMWVEKTRQAVEFPIFGSLNATSMGNWIEYAKLLESAGCNGLELNIYAVETDQTKSAADIENRALDVVSAVKSSVTIPVAVKLSPYYTAMASVARRMVEAGADGLVLFNRFYQPVIDPETESLKINLDLSTPQEMRLSLRWIAILSGSVGADLAASTGVHSGADVARQLLAGAQVTQTVSAVLKNGIDYVGKMNQELASWMDAKGYGSIDQFRGKLSQKNMADPFAFERAQYVRLLLGHD